MNPVNIDKSKNSSADIQGSSKLNSSDKFDLSIIGRIDLAEAEKIASEEVIFLTESDLIEGLEDFELVPIKSYRDDQKTGEIVKSVPPVAILKEEPVQENHTESIPEKIVTEVSVQENEIPVKDEIVTSASESLEIIKSEILTPELETADTSVFKEEHDIDLIISEINQEDLIEITDKPLITESIVKTEPLKIIDEPKENIKEDIKEDINEELLTARKLFTVKINEETVDSQLSAILSIENLQKKDDKILEKYSDAISDPRCKFVDDQFFNNPVSDESVSYNEDPLTERLVKMIEVADGKLELLERTAKEDEKLSYILEDYTLYNAEKFDNVFKEEVFYIDSDFEFIDNAIIRDDFTKYIHEIDDYFESEESLIQSEISEILGLIPEEDEYIEDKLFGDYYKRYDLDNEIDFIKPEIDFFRSSYTGKKNSNYFSENEVSLLDSEKISIEEDISSPDAIIFEEDVAEIEAILKRDFDFKPEIVKEPIIEEKQIIQAEEIPDITDKIIILEDKEKLMELASEFPDKHENLIRLLSYLDGLFEKLPEEVIRKFADSEYFELYSKVLKEMGV